jgi:hypothetical protein
MRVADALYVSIVRPESQRRVLLGLSELLIGALRRRLLLRRGVLRTV